MGKVLKVLGIVWGVCKRFDLEELEDIWAEIQEAIKCIKEARGASKGEKAAAYIKAGEELVDIYEVALDAYND